MGGWGWVGWVESIIKLISAEAEAEALLGLAELGNKSLHAMKTKHVLMFRLIFFCSA